METTPLPADRLIWEAMELAAQTGVIAADPEADPALRERCRRLHEAWRREWDWLQGHLDRHVDDPLTEEDYEAASPEVQAWADKGDRELEASGQRFKAALAEFMDAGGLGPV